MAILPIEVPDELADQTEHLLNILEQSAEDKEVFDDVSGILDVAGLALRNGKGFNIGVGQSVSSERLRRLYGRACGYKQESWEESDTPLVGESAKT